MLTCFITNYTRKTKKKRSQNGANAIVFRDQPLVRTHTESETRHDGDVKKHTDTQNKQTVWQKDATPKTKDR